MSELAAGGGPAPANKYTAPSQTAATLVGELSAATAQILAEPLPQGIVTRERALRVRKMRTDSLANARDILADMSPYTPADEAMRQLEAGVATRQVQDGDVRSASREISRMREPLSPERRAQLLNQVREVAQGDMVSATLTTPTQHGRYGQPNTFGFRSPLDSNAPGRNADPISEGVAFTPARRMSGSTGTYIVMDYQFEHDGHLAVTRVGMQPDLGYQILAETVRDPELARDVINVVLDTRANNFTTPGSEVIRSAFEQNPTTTIRILDGVTTGAPIDEISHSMGGRLFAPPEIYLQYPAQV